VLSLFDRGEDLIRTSSGPVSSIEIEAALYEHPAVREAGVVEVAGDPDAPEIVAAVALRAPVDPAVLREFVAGQVEPAAVPTRVVVVDTLPRSQKGKVRKGDLRTMVAAQAVAPR